MQQSLVNMQSTNSDWESSLQTGADRSYNLIENLIETLNQNKQKCVNISQVIYFIEVNILIHVRIIYLIGTKKENE